MLYAVKGNTEVKIQDDYANDYAKQGYDIYKLGKDDKLKLVTGATNKVVSFEKYAELEAENAELKKEIEALKKPAEEVKK